MPPTGILHTEMDEETLLEIEIQQDLDRLNLDDDNFIVDNDDNEAFPVVAEDVVGSEDEGLPAELQDYINAIQKQRQRFEEELEECDTVIDRAISTVREAGDGEKAMVVHGDWKELEEEATRHGMTVEDYRKKLLQDIEDEPFELEEMDFITDDSEFVLPESGLDKILKTPEAAEISMALVELPLRGNQEPSDDDLMIEKALKIARAMEAEQRSMEEGQEGEHGASLVPVTSVTGSSVGEDGADTGQLVPVSNPDPEGQPNPDRHPHQAPVVAGTLNVDENNKQEGSDNCLVPAWKEEDDEDTRKAASDGVGSSESGTSIPAKESPGGALVVIHSNPLLEFEQYLREQFQLAEERFRQRELHLKQELEARREVEEKLMLTLEQHKLETLHTLQQEEQRLAHQKQESQKKLDQEIQKQQKVLEKELKHHEETIATLTTQLEEDRYQLNKVQRAEEERVAQRDGKAATTIQRCYKGYMVRKLHQSDRQMLAEKREQRKEEKQQRRIQEVEQEIQQRKEEEERKTVEARRAKEEEERKIEEEKQRQEKEERLKKEEEERKKKEEEERKKKEEERKRKAKEEKERREEEERRLKEEQERKKQEEEERQRREEEERKKREEEERKRKEEEEQKRKEEEERKRKEEEEERKRKEEEEKQRKEEEERQKHEEEQKRLEEERKRKENEETLRMEKEHESQAEKQKQEETREVDERTETSPRKEQGKREKSEKDSHQSENSQISSTDKETPGGGRNKEGQLQDCENGYAVSPVVLDLEPVNANILSNSLEERRLAWMKNCLPWSKISNEPWKLKSATGEKVPRRPASAKKLPPLPENLILESAQVASLRQVTTVELKDLPGHALSPLGSCSQLKHLTVTRCGLIALDGLSQCRHLQCLNVEDNLIEFVDLKELGSLYTLNLSHNKLSSVHGLEGCTNLRWLDVSHNRLTKLVGLSPLRRLHTLQASHNQLVSTKGLETCPTVQQLDLSANYLTSVQGLEKLGLLLSLNVASNNLTQMPPLENNVLLQELVLRENSIGPDLDLSSAWLPLLFYLDLSQNIIEELTGSAGGLFVLKRLDLAVNQITDISSFLPALSDCPRLEDLSLQGNAVLDEENFTDTVRNSISCLLCLNGETLRSQASVASAGQHVRCFELLCLNQLQLHRDIKNAFDKDCRSVPGEGKMDKSHVCDSYFKFCDKSFRTAVEHRYAHEYGELSPSNLPNPPHTPRPPSAQTPRVSGHARHRMHGTPANSAGGKDTASHGTDEENSPTLHNSSSAGNTPKKNSASTVPTEENSVVDDTRKSPVLSQKEKFDLALRAEANSLSAVRSEQAQMMGNVGAASVFGQPSSEGWGEPAEENVGARGSLSGANNVGGHRMEEKPEQPEPPQLSAKEKFERVLMGMPTTPSPLPPVVAPHQNINGQSSVFAEIPPNSSSKKQSGITADVVGDLMMSETGALTRSALPNKFLEDDDDLDDLEEMMEGLQFDIDGFLDLDQFDFDEDFLEKGWRPEDTPQMPQKIPSSSAKPPLPPVHNPSTPHSPAPLPPGRPAQAWRSTDTPPLGDIQTHVPPLRPPSSIGSGEDSQAMTTGRARKEERLAEEWGFKDSRTAELMMQRANKMKYNAERRRKLSKLDPQQRLRLFRKLEEAKGVRTVRPPPARVLPRKEYFQAREEEALQRDVEKQMEYKTKAGRTFEWLHTQVGDYNVSSSRINPGAGGGAGKQLMKTASDSQLSHHPSPSPHGYSPVSMDIESASSVGSHQQAGRQQRHSLAGDELTLTGHSPLLPPIKTSSASSHHSREREKMSWRTEPKEKNVGWGGGKKRLVRK